MRRTALWALVVKDLRLFFGDRRAVVVILLTPIAIGLFFGYLFSGGSSETARVPIRVVDQDGSALSRAVVEGLRSDTSLEVVACPLAEAREAVRRGKATVAVVLPEGFGDTAAKAFFGQTAKAEVTMLYDPSHGPELAMVRGILTQHVMEAASREAFTGEAGRKAVDDALANVAKSPDIKPEDRRGLTDLLSSVARWQDQLKKEEASGEKAPAGGLSMPFAVKEEAVTARRGVAYNSYAHSFAGMAIQFILFAAIDLGVGVLLERQMGLWKRLRGAPLTRATLLFAKTISGALIALLTLGTTFAFAMVFCGVRVQGSLVGFLALCAASALMASAFGLMLAALGSTPGATRGIAILAVLLLVMLGGGWVPAFVFPGWMQRLTLVVPTRWAVDGLDAVTWRGVGLAGALPAIGVVLLFALLFGLVAVARFRWDEG
jgi:ABC-2 type transport system permease protein